MAGHTEKYDAAARTAAKIVKRFIADPLAGDSLLNNNIPAVSMDEILGTEVTRLGSRYRTRNLIMQDDPRGERIFWIGPVGETADD